MKERKKKRKKPKPSTREKEKERETERDRDRERERQTDRQTDRERLESELGGGVVRTQLTYLSNCALGRRVGHEGLICGMGCLFMCLQTVKYVVETFSELCESVVHCFRQNIHASIKLESFVCLSLFSAFACAIAKSLPLSG